MKNANTNDLHTTTLPATVLANPEGVSSKYGDLLDCMKYSREGGLATPDNLWHDDHFYCRAVEVRITTPDGKSVGLRRNPHEQFCHSVAKKWRLSRDFLPDRVHIPQECEEQCSVVSQTLIECLVDGVPAEGIVRKCFEALDSAYGVYKQDTHKTLPREENLWAPERAFIATLFTGDLATVGGKPSDLTADCEFGDLSAEGRGELKRLVALFDKVKEAHKFAPSEKWLAAQCYALGMPTEDGIRTVYGAEVEKAASKPAKTAKHILHTCSVKYRRHANEVFGWLLDEVEKNPAGLERWSVVLDHCKAMVAATTTLEECAVKCRLDDKVVKYLRSEIPHHPQAVLRYCEAVKAELEPVNA